MEHNTSLREKAMRWWKNLSSSTRDKAMDDYFIERDEESLTGREIETIYLKEHPTEAEVSKEEETFEQKWVNRLNILKKNREKDGEQEYHSYDELIHQNAEFIRDLRKQKEKDRELIDEMTSLLKSYHYQLFGGYPNETITKAEKRLNDK